MQKQELLSGSTSTDILDIQDTADLLGFTVGSIYQMTSKRIIPHFKVPGLRKVYFSKRELEQWILNDANRVVTRQELVLLALNRCQN